jgi:hypothetical protein
MVSKLLPWRQLGLGLVELGWRRADMTPPYSGCATATSEAGRAARDVEASVLCAERCDITQPSSCITNTSVASLVADAGRVPHWPHPGGGAPSSVTSTTAAQSPAAGTSVGDADVTAVTAVAAAAVSSYCGLVATAVLHGGSHVPAPITTSLSRALPT